MPPEPTPGADSLVCGCVHVDVCTRVNVIRIFDGIEGGIEDITTDQFTDDFVKNLKLDAKAVEKEFGQGAHQPQTV